MTQLSSRTIPMGRAGSRRASVRICAAVLAACVALGPGRADAGQVVSVETTGVTPGAVFSVTATGLDAVAANNRITFIPVAGAPLTVAATSSAIVDKTRGIRRVSVRVPAGLEVGIATVSVLNTVTNETTDVGPINILSLSLPDVRIGAPGTIGAQVVVRAGGAAAFVQGQTRVTFGAGIAVRAVTVLAANELRATIDIAATAAEGPRAVSVTVPRQSLVLMNAFAVATGSASNQDPVARFTVTPASAETGQAMAFDGASSSDADGDALRYAWVFGDGETATDANASHAFATATTFTVTLTVSDGRGGSNATSQAVVITAPPPTNHDPVAAFSFAPASPQTNQAVTFDASASTDPDTDTLTYEWAFGDGVTATGVSASHTFGTTTTFTVSLTVRDGRGGANTTTRSVAVTLPPVTVTALDLAPSGAALRAVGATLPLALTASFSDNSTRVVTADAATVYESSDASVATVSPAGLATAAGAGRTTITALFGGLAATMQLDVVLGSATGTGFVRGEVFDDRTGLPLPGAVAALIADANGPVPAPTAITADARGRFVLAARAGAIVVRITKPGFTAVDRVATVGSDTAVTLLDARLTPVEAPRSVIAGIFGGDAANALSDVALLVAPGTLTGSTAFTITTTSNQGLAGRLPLGWSPVFAVELGPGVAFAAPATLRVPVLDPQIAPNSDVVVARYDLPTQSWVAIAPARVSPDGKSMVATVEATGQFAFLVADDVTVHAGLTPGTPLPRGTRVSNPEPSGGGAQAEEAGVEPRSAPPGHARARGRLAVRFDPNVASGAVVRAGVSERFTLLDQSQVVPLPFTEDIVLYARPRIGAAGTLGATFAITPTLDFTIQQLALGTVTLDVSVDEAAGAGAVVGATRGVVGDPAGALLEVPDGALAADTFVGLAPIDPLAPPLPMPAGLTLLGGASVDLVGTTFARAASLSIPRPAGLPDDAIVVLGEVFVDPLGGRRLRIAGVGQVGAARVTVQLVSSGLTLPGVSRGADYVFVRLVDPIGFVDGSVRASGGAAPFAGALITSDTSPFADLSSAAGRFIVAGRVGAATTVRALDTTGGDGASAEFTPAAAFGVTPLTLTLGVASPTVIETSPAAGATNIPLDATIVVTFSEPIDPASVTPASIVVRVGTTEIAGARVVSADRRRVTFRPDAPLAGNTAHTVSITTAILDASGNPMAAPAAFEFRTLDPSKPPQPDPGRITAELPDEDGFVLVTGSPGTSEASRGVTATNLRTQETITVLAIADGSFRLRVAAVLGDEVVLTFREADGRESTLSLTQFTNADGTTSIGAAGGTVTDGTRTGRIRPRALTSAGTFLFREAMAGALPGATGDFAYVDQFSVSIGGAQFTQLRSLALSESQDRFAQVTAGDAPWVASGSLVVPADFLVSANLRFTAVATDATGRRSTAEGATQVVGNNPQTERVEVTVDAQFPTVFLDVPRQALPNQQVVVEAVAPSARIDVEVAAPPPGGGLAPAFFLVSPVAVGSDRKLEVLDQLVLAVATGASVLRSNGRSLPGVVAAGDYGVVGVPGAIAFITGRVTGPAAVVTIDGWPFVAVTTTANGRFVLPVRGDASLTLKFLDAASFAELGRTPVQAPADGARDIGAPLGAPASTMTVTATPGAQSVVDIGDPIVFTFSEAVDPSSVGASTVVVTDTAGRRVLGAFARSDDGVVVTFTPSRRWKYATKYRYGVSAAVRAVSGATLALPLSGEFTTFTPRVLGNVPGLDVRDIATAGTIGVAATSTGFAVLDITNPLQPSITAQVPLAGGGRAVELLTASLVGRNGAAVPGPIAVIVAGDGVVAATLQSWSLAAPAVPVLVGLTQLTVPPGGNAPAGVRNAQGIPADVVVDETARAFVAIRGVGVETVDLRQSIPLDQANVARGLGPRHPESGIADVIAISLLDNALIVLGADGLTLLDKTTMLKVLPPTTTPPDDLVRLSLPADGPARLRFHGPALRGVTRERFAA